MDGLVALVLDYMVIFGAVGWCWELRQGDAN